MILQLIKKTWGASGGFWQCQWDLLLDTVGDDPKPLWIYGTLLYTFAVYWLIGGIFTFCDLTNRPAALRRYKIQPGTNEPVKPWVLVKASALVIFNQLIVGYPAMYISYALYDWRGFPPVRELPTFFRMLVEILVHMVFLEIGFYYPHRFLLHRPSLYKYIHKHHHKWTSPIAVTALYCHPLEHITSDLTAPFIGILLVGSHFATAWIWLTITTIITLNHHSGYHLPFAPSPESHDFHHAKSNQCFGIFGILDRLHGTDTKFRNSQAGARNQWMLNFVPIRKVFPDKKIENSKSL